MSGSDLPVRRPASIGRPGSLAGRATSALHSPHAAHQRRRRVVAAVTTAGAGMLGLSFSTRPGSRLFYASTLGTAATWALGGFASGPLHRGWAPVGSSLRRPVVTPIVTGGSVFGVFYAGALVVRRVPVLDAALRKVLRFAEDGSQPLVLISTLANGVAEEIFFRGAVYAAAGDRHPVASSTALYTLVTSATRNPALVLAGGVMGTVFGLQRRSSGGIQAPILTHVTWAALMVRYMPALFSSNNGRPAELLPDPTGQGVSGLPSRAQLRPGRRSAALSPVWSAERSRACSSRPPWRAFRPASP
jgi:CAAX protease family protein